MTPPGQLKEQLCHPERGSEPLFRAVRAAGFFWQGLNSFDSTASAPLADMEDSRFIPKLLVKVIQDRLRPHAGYLHFKLDWLLGRDVHALKYEEFVDGDTGIPSLAPGCVQSQRIGIERISDHAPIYADLRIG